MESSNRHIHQSYTLDDDLEFHGLVGGSLTVPSGHELRLYGLVTGDLIIEKDAIVHVAGKVNGTVINKGGRVKIDGMVGAVRDLDAAIPSVISRNARIIGIS